jgi:hypothetical protein
MKRILSTVAALLFSFAPTVLAKPAAAAPSIPSTALLSDTDLLQSLQALKTEAAGRGLERDGCDDDCREESGSTECTPSGTFNRMDPTRCGQNGYCSEDTYRRLSCRTFDGCGNLSGEYEDEELIRSGNACTPC